MEDFSTVSKSEAVYEEDDEFYEKIEAPKFVDLRVPDRSMPDDRTWFCLRVGCDQKHEENMDPDALYRNFVLRVMAARSPNVRLRKALRQAPSGIPTCPQSAPPKSTRTPKSIVMSQIPQKSGDAKVEVPIISKFKSTPCKGTGKVKQSSIAKALTTPRNKSGSQNQEPFRSVRNPKAPIMMLKNRTVAKALIFSSPTKNGKETSSKSGNDICVEMKKLKISLQKKNVASRYRSTLNIGKSNLRTCNLHSNISQDSKSQQAFSIRVIKKCEASVAEKGIENGSRSNMEIDGKNGSLGENRNKETRGVTSTSDEEPLEEKGFENGSSSDMEIDGKLSKGYLEESRNEETLGVTSMAEEGSLLSLDEAFIKENFLSTSDEEHLEVPISKGSFCETKAMESYDNENVSNCTTSEVTSTTKEKLLHSLQGCQDKDKNFTTYLEKVVKQDKNDTIVQVSNREIDDIETIDGADNKENTSASDRNRDIGRSERKNGPRGEALVKQKKALLKNKSSAPAPAPAGDQVEKNKKTKATNPKPFRLRTDERGILKEANLEKRRLRLLAPLDAPTQITRIPKGNSHNNQQNGKPKEGSSLQEGRQTASVKTKLRAELQQVGSTYLKSTKSAERRTVKRDQQKPKLEGRQKSLRNLDRDTLKSPASRVVGVTTAGGPAGNTMSSSSRKRPATIPQEPNFQRVHVPRDCHTKKMVPAF